MSNAASSLDLVSATLLLLVIMDPLGNIPIFLSVLEKVEHARRRWVLFRELVVALIIMGVFLLAGRGFLQLFALREEAVSIAGAIVLMIIAMRMIFPGDSHWADDVPDGEPFIVPMAIPLIAGPSLLATLMLFTSREPERLADWGTATVIAWSINAAILMSSTLLYKVLRQRGLIALERLMGLVLVAVAVQMFLDGFAVYLPTVLHPAGQ